jgi:hypothetical protein
MDNGKIEEADLRLAHLQGHWLEFVHIRVSMHCVSCISNTAEGSLRSNASKCIGFVPITSKDSTHVCGWEVKVRWRREE